MTDKCERPWATKIHSDSPKVKALKKELAQAQLESLSCLLENVTNYVPGLNATGYCVPGNNPGSIGFSESALTYAANVKEFVQNPVVVASAVISAAVSSVVSVVMWRCLGFRSAAGGSNGGDGPNGGDDHGGGGNNGGGHNGNGGDGHGGGGNNGGGNGGGDDHGGGGGGHNGGGGGNGNHGGGNGGHSNGGGDIRPPVPGPAAIIPPEVIPHVGGGSSSAIMPAPSAGSAMREGIAEPVGSAQLTLTLRLRQPTAPAAVGPAHEEQHEAIALLEAIAIVAGEEGVTDVDVILDAEVLELEKIAATERGAAAGVEKPDDLTASVASTDSTASSDNTVAAPAGSIAPEPPHQ